MKLNAMSQNIFARIFSASLLSKQHYKEHKIVYDVEKHALNKSFSYHVQNDIFVVKLAC